MRQLKEDYEACTGQGWGGAEGPEDMSFYASADTLLVPSLCYENTPTVITEAHSHGLRVVASLIGGIPEMLLPNDIAIEPANRQMWKDALYKE